MNPRMPAISMLALIGVLVSCSPIERTDNISTLTWEKAKADTQQMELAISNLIPPSAVLNVTQQEKGGLFRCGGDQHRWEGATTVAVTSDADIDAIVMKLERHYAGESRFIVSTRRNIADQYELQLVDPHTTENYIIAEFGTDAIRIASSSPCFTLPEGVYPGGDF